MESFSEYIALAREKGRFPIDLKHLPNQYSFSTDTDFVTLGDIVHEAGFTQKANEGFISLEEHRTELISGTIRDNSTFGNRSGIYVLGNKIYQVDDDLETSIEYLEPLTIFQFRTCTHRPKQDKLIVVGNATVSIMERLNEAGIKSVFSINYGSYAISNFADLK